MFCDPSRCPGEAPFSDVTNLGILEFTSRLQGFSCKKGYPMVAMTNFDFPIELFQSCHSGRVIEFEKLKFVIGVRIYLSI